MTSEPSVEQLDDSGYLRICLDGVCTTCSSMHLVEDKIKQLERWHENNKRMTPQDAVKQLRTQTDLPGATDIRAMNNRVLALEWLYRLQGRKDAKPGLRGTYTGLWQSIQ